MGSYGKTDIGQHRKINQDYIFLSDKPVGSLPNLYIVADGMGGHKAGEYASKFSVEHFINEIKQSKKHGVVTIMKAAIETVNTELLRESETNDDYVGMGTTFVAAVMEDGQIYAMNVGDSRLYLIDDAVEQITMDHSLVEEMYRCGQLTKTEAKNHPEKNIITRALGAGKEVVPDFFEVAISSGQHILLCSDGLSNMLEDDEIGEVIKDGKTLEEAVNKLVERANFYGGMDNISAILVEYE